MKPRSGRLPGLAVELRVDARRLLIVGDGPVAMRRLVEAVEAGALIDVFAPNPSDALTSTCLEHGVPLHARLPDALELAAAFVILLVTPSLLPRVDWPLGPLLWVHDEPSSSHLTMPAILKCGPLRIAVSSGGRSSALSRLLRDALVRVLDERLAAWAWACLDSKTPSPPLRVTGSIKPPD